MNDITATGNDITPLVQRMKTAALKAKSEANEWGYDTDAFHDEATPDAVIQVVEALEASDAEFKNSVRRESAARNKIDEQAKRIAELEESHAQVIQARDHYKRMAEEGLKGLQESRAVTVKLPDVEKWRKPDAVRAQNAYRVLTVNTLSAAGINVEAE